MDLVKTSKTFFLEMNFSNSPQSLQNSVDEFRHFQQVYGADSPSKVNHLVIYSRNGRIITGWGYYYGNEVCELFYLHVGTEYRRQGVGKAILNAMIRDSEKLGVKFFILRCTETNEARHGLLSFIERTFVDPHNKKFEVYIDGKILKL